MMISPSCQPAPTLSWTENRQLHQLFEEKVEHCADAAAVRLESQVQTYEDLNRAANRFAAYLLSHGLAQGAVVGVCIDRSHALMPVLLGILKAGAAYLPLDPTFPPERLRYIADDAEMAFLVIQTTYAELLPVAAPIFDIQRDWDRLASFSDQNPVLPLSHDTLAYLIYTSGSTGMPKGVKVSHANVTNLMLSMAKTPGLAEGDLLLAITTISFDIHALELFLPISVGACVYLASRSISADAFKLLDVLNRFPITTLQATPVTWRMLISAGWQGSPQFKALIGGEALPRELVAPLLERSGQLWNMYGPTETTVWSTCHRVVSADDIISVGKPIDNTQVYIVNKQGDLVKDFEEGEIIIGGRGVTMGYHRRPELTAEKFIADRFSGGSAGLLYRTGDLARYGKDGNIVHLGRIDSQIKIHGYRIEPGEIEAVLCMHPNIEQAVVALIDADQGAPRLVAFCRGTGALNTGSLRAHAGDHLPEYMVPKLFLGVDELPLTPSGKIDRRSLISHQKHLLHTSAVDPGLPESDLEKALLVAWRKILNNNTIGIDDTFVEAGGESILAFDLVVEMNRVTGINFPYEKMLENPTVKDLATSVSTDRLSSSYNVVPLQAQGNKAPLYCLCGVSLYQELANNIGADRPTFGIYAPKEIELLNKTIAGQKTQITVESLAVRYCEAILQQKSDAPIQILGFSFGGVLAVETARLLQLHGKKIAVVILVDSVLPHAIRSNLLKRISWCYRFLKNVLSVNTIRAGLAGLKKISGRSEQSRKQRQSIKIRLKQARVGILRSKTYDSSTSVYLASEHRYEGKVVLIKALDNEILNCKDLAPDYGWSRTLIQPPKIHQVGGRHLETIRGDYGRKTASIVQQYLC